MSEIQLLSIAYVVFMVLIGGELALSWWRGDGRYRLGEFVVNIGHGAVFQVSDGFTKVLVLAPFLWLSEQVPVALPMDALWGWVVGLLAYDFASYWRHRHHHRVHALWAIHGVHHAAEDFNFAAALRQALFQNVSGWLWTLPLALFLPVPMFVGLVVFDYAYQFVQHTRYVPKLGPVEWVFNTPSHHRVHHGRQAQYVDKNYGGILIIWDRLFGTFAEEQEEPDYGITMPPNSLNAVWGNFVLWQDLLRASRQTPGLWNKARLWLGPPELTEVLAGPVPKRTPAPLENATIPTGRLRRVALGFLGGVAVLGALPWIPGGDVGLRLALGAVVVLTVVGSGGLLEERPWARWVEAVRLLVTVGLIGLLATTGQAPLALAGLVFCVLAAAVGLLMARPPGRVAAQQDA